MFGEVAALHGAKAVMPKPSKSKMAQGNRYRFTVTGFSDAVGARATIQKFCKDEGLGEARVEEGRTTGNVRRLKLSFDLTAIEAESARRIRFALQRRLSMGSVSANELQ
jgi:hypothetical protein